MTSQTQKMTRKRSKKCSLSSISWTTIQVFIFTAWKMEFFCAEKLRFHGKTCVSEFFDFGYALTGGEGETPISFPIQFKNGMAQVHITFYHSSFFLYPYCMVLLVVCIGFFLFLVLFFVSRKMKQIIRLKDDVLVMAGGDLSHPFPDYQKMKSESSPMNLIISASPLTKIYSPSRRAAKPIRT